MTRRIGCVGRCSHSGCGRGGLVRTDSLRRSLLVMAGLLSVIGGGCVVEFNDSRSVCGDGLLSDTEECDDGNLENGDGCSRACFVETGWDCEGGPSTCSPVCGDGRLIGGEECDGSAMSQVDCQALGLGSGYLGCLSSCRFDVSGCQQQPECGNGKREYGEDCDGDDIGGQTCEGLGLEEGALRCGDDCRFDVTGCAIAAECGDGILDGAEECDDGNSDSGDGCDGSCHVETGWNCKGEPSVCQSNCGNGNLDPGEECDGGGQDRADCDADCTLPECGDGYVNEAAGEDCDNGIHDTASCDRDCTVPECGDGHVNEAAGEQCDDGNLANGDGCDGSCQEEAGWTCDGEPSDCAPICGDGRCLAEGGEGHTTCPQDCGTLAIAAGTDHACAVLGDGTAWCWGDNGFGQLGDGTTQERHRPVQVSNLTNVSSIVAGWYHTCATLLDGHVWCWGYNSDGQLGDGTTQNSNIPVQVSDLTNVSSITSGEYQVCAALGDGSAWCWGRNDYGELGDGTTTEQHSPVQVLLP